MLDKIQQEIILCDVFAFYNIDLVDMLTLNNSKPIRTRTVSNDMSTVELH